MNRLNCVSRSPKTEDCGDSSYYRFITVQEYIITLNLYLIKSPSNTLLEESFSRDMAANWNNLRGEWKETQDWGCFMKPTLVDELYIRYDLILGV